MIHIWKLSFWGTILGLLVVQFTSPGLVGSVELNGVSKIVAVMLLFIMWTYALYRAYTNKVLWKKVMLFVLSFTTFFIAGYVLYIYDLLKRNKSTQG